MSSTTISSSNYCYLINKALTDYVDHTGIDLKENPFAEKLQSCDSANAIFDLLQEKAKAFKEYRDGNRKLIDWLSPVVQVLHTFSGIIGEVTALVSPVGSLPPFSSICFRPRYRFHLRKRSLSVWTFSSRYLSIFLFINRILITSGTIRQLVVSVQVMTLSSTFSNVSEISSNAFKFIPRSR
jgi:hypothetical protein